MIKNRLDDTGKTNQWTGGLSDGNHQTEHMQKI